MNEWMDGGCCDYQELLLWTSHSRMKKIAHKWEVVDGVGIEGVIVGQFKTGKRESDRDKICTWF